MQSKGPATGHLDKDFLSLPLLLTNSETLSKLQAATARF
jgi:hypothetical protein